MKIVDLYSPYGQPDIFPLSILGKSHTQNRKISWKASHSTPIIHFVVRKNKKIDLCFSHLKTVVSMLLILFNRRQFQSLTSK